MTQPRRRHRRQFPLEFRPLMVNVLPPALVVVVVVAVMEEQEEKQACFTPRGREMLKVSRWRLAVFDVGMRYMPFARPCVVFVFVGRVTATKTVG